MKNSTAQTASDIISSGISPWGSQSLYFDPAWEYRHDEENWITCVADNQGIIIVRLSGWLRVDDMIKLTYAIRDVHEKLLWQEKPWALLVECSLLSGMDISARGKFIEFMIAQSTLAGVVFSTPSHLIKSLVQLALKFYSPIFPISIGETLRESCLKFCNYLPVPQPDFAIPVLVDQEETMSDGCRELDAVLRTLGEIYWNKPGVELLEEAAKDSPWKTFLHSMAVIKNDLDTMIVKREERLKDLQQINVIEVALQQKLSSALEFSQKARVVFEQESRRNLMLSQVVIDTQKETLFALGEIIESRSKETANHIRRVAEYSRLLAQFSGMGEREQQQILHASPMHDAGKIAIPDSILNKPGKLTNEEFSTMKEHARLGWQMLKSSPLGILQHAAKIALQHHEKWNGKGYPDSLQKEEICIFARMVALADVFDALGSDRCYKKAWPLEKVLVLIQEERGEHFDPQLVDIFFANLGAFLTIRERFPDATS